MPSVFISYRRVQPDADLARRLYNALAVQGADPWLDIFHIEPSARWDDEIQQALHTCSHLVLLHSHESNISENCKDEWAFFLKQKKIVVPLMLDQTALHYRLDRLQYVDFRGDFDQAVAQLMTILPRKQAINAAAAPDAPTPEHPGDPATTAQATFQRARAAMHLHQYPQAITAYTEYLKLVRDAAGYNNRGSAYYMLKNVDSALEDFSTAIEIDPFYALAYFNRALVNYARLKLEPALKDISYCLELNPTQPRGHALRGGIYGASGDYEKALADFDRAVELEPDNSKNYSERGVAWLNLGDHAAAIRDLDTAVRLDPKDGNAYYNLACVHALEGHTTSALLLLKTALANGYHALDHAAQDADFISLRDDARFWEILGREQPE